MGMNITQHRASTGLVEKYIGTAYDNVKRVSEELEAIINVSDALIKDVDFEVLANVLINIKDNAEDLAALAQADLIAISDDLNKGNFLGNRKIDINLALNIKGITEELIRDDPNAAEALWTNPTNTVFYDKAVVTFVDGEVVDFPFMFDENPVFISTHGDLLAQFNRYDNQTAVAQEILINNIVAVNGYTYRVTINGIAFDYIADADATVPEIVSALVQSINVTEANGSVPVTAVDQVTSLKLVADVPGDEFIAYGNGNMKFSTLVQNVEGGAVENPVLAKLENTGMIGIAADVVGEIVRFYDIIGKNSNLERIQLHAVSGNYIYQNLDLFWAKTTSSLQTLAMRAGDIIKLGNELDNIIILATSIEEVLEVQARIPQLVDTFQEDGTPNGNVTIYNKLFELDTLYQSLTSLLVLFEDMKSGGNNYIQSVGSDLQTTGYTASVGTDLQDVNSKVIEVGTDFQTNNYTTIVGTDLQDLASKIIEVGTDLQTTGYTTSVATDLQSVDSKVVTLGTDFQTSNFTSTVGTDLQDAESKIIEVGTDIQTTGYTTSVATDLQDANSKIIEVGSDFQTNNYTSTVGADLQDLTSKITETATDLQAVDSKIKEVANNLQTTDTIGTVATNIADVNTTANNIADVNTVSTSISDVSNVSTNITNVNTVANSHTSINTVSASITDVNTVATNISDVNTVSANIVDVQNAEENANTAIQKALEASNSADAALQSENNAAVSAQDAATKAAEIKNVSVGSTITGAAGTNAAVIYNPASGEFTFVVPQGIKGDRGDAFEVNSVGNLAERTLYDTRTKGFSFLAIDEATIYFKLSDTSGDWSLGAPFGKGDKGDKGDTGNGIATIGFTGTTDPSGNPGQNGATDTYTISYTDGTSTTFPVYNGLDSAVLSVAGRTGDVTLTKTDVGLSNVDNTSDLDKPISNATQVALNSLTKADVGLGNVDNTSDLNKPISNATQAALNSLTKSSVGLENVDNTSDLNKPISFATQSVLDLKANSADVYSQTEIDNALATKANSSDLTATAQQQAVAMAIVFGA
jgi:hypothetical protein